MPTNDSAAAKETNEVALRSNWGKWCAIFWCGWFVVEVGSSAQQHTQTHSVTITGSILRLSPHKRYGSDVVRCDNKKNEKQQNHRHWWVSQRIVFSCFVCQTVRNINIETSSIQGNGNANASLRCLFGFVRLSHYIRVRVSIFTHFTSAAISKNIKIRTRLPRDAGIVRRYDRAPGSNRIAFALNRVAERKRKQKISYAHRTHIAQLLIWM